MMIDTKGCLVILGGLAALCFVVYLFVDWIAG